MALTVLTAATSRRLTTAEALYDDTGDVFYLEEPTKANALIDQASAAIEGYLGRILAQQRYLLITGQRPEVCLPLHEKTRPIVTVDGIEAGDTTVTDYRIENAEAGLLYRRDGWGRYRGLDDLEVTYVAGYILPEQTTPPGPSGLVLPADIEHATIETAKVWRHERLPESRVVSRTLGDQRIEYAVQAGRRAIPVLAQHMLSTYKPWVMR